MTIDDLFTLADVMNERPPVEEAIDRGDVQDLLKVWDDFNSAETWRGVAAKNMDDAAAARVLSQLPEVTALEALRANARAVALLTARRWYVMQAAREAGSTWAQIGEAVGMTELEAQDFYRSCIREQEKHLPDLHDAARAQAVLED